MLANEADPNLISKDGSTPLLLGITKELFPKIKLILLNIACNSSDNLIATIRILLDKGADPKVKNFTNKSVLGFGNSKSNSF